MINYMKDELPKWQNWRMKCRKGYMKKVWLN